MTNNSNSRRVYSTRTGQGQRHFKTKVPVVSALHAIHKAAQTPPALPALPTLEEAADAATDRVIKEELGIDLSRHNGLGWVK